MANAAQEIESLMVRLVGDGSHYKKTLDAATKQTDKAVKKIDKDVNKASASANKLTATWAATGHRLAVPLRKTAQETEKLKKKTEETALEFKRGQAPVRAYTTRLDRLRDAAAGLQTRGLMLAATGIAGVSRAANAGIGRLRRFNVDLLAVGAAARKTGMMMSLGATLTFGGILAGVAKAGAGFETASLQFEVMLGKDKGAKMLANLQQFAKVTPFQTDKVVDATKVLLSFGVEQDKVLGTMRMLGDVSAGSGKDLKELAVIYGQIKALGTLQGQDMLQLVNAGISYTDVAKTLGVTVAEMKDMMSKGQVSADAIGATLTRMTAEGGRFANMSERLSTTAAGRFSTLLGEIQLLAIELGTMLLPTMHTIIAAVRAAVAWFSQLSPTVKQVAIITAIVVAVVGPLLVLVGMLIPAIAAVAKVMGLVSIGGVVLAAKLAIIVAGVAAVVDAFTGGKLGFLDFIRSIRIGGFKLETWMFAIVGEIRKIWASFTDFFVGLFDKMIAAFLHFAEFLLQGVIKVGQMIFKGFMWVADKVVGIGTFITDKFTSFLGWIGILSDETVKKVDATTDAIHRGMGAAADFGDNFYEGLVNDSKGRQDRRHDKFLEEEREREKSLKRFKREMDATTDNEFMADIKERKREEKKKEALEKKKEATPFVMPDLPEFKVEIPKVGVPEIKPLDSMDTAGGGVEQEGRRMDFKSIALNRISLAGIASADRRKEQEVRAPGVERRLIELVKIMDRAQTKPAVLAE